ncbi:glyoxalase superfamily protein [Ancylobacter defluvii]|uniref:glyoxalase superfamily protein n=1 Tax=Ancylobacter defluvii TaxID=1282440 RepID=UPI001BD157A3|nr:glyoxalase superfamily protein [Ancylobacter defluvii]MBS7586458.1 VOC family protein [Ancylobacter defluvii]
MESRQDAKFMAKALRAALAGHGIDLPHGHALDLVAAQFGAKDWNVLAAQVPEERAAGPVSFRTTAPILRIFDEAKALDFYVGFLGFTLDWEHRFAPGLPLYAQVSRAGLVLHLSGHHGDATPGSTVFVAMEGVRAYNAELLAKQNPNMRPGVEALPWGQQMEVTDPFGNRIRFCEQRHGGG